MKMTLGKIALCDNQKHKNTRKGGCERWKREERRRGGWERIKRRKKEKREDRKKGDEGKWYMAMYLIKQTSYSFN